MQNATYGKSVCIIGAGNVGTECAKRFKAFGCKIFGVDVFPKEDENYENVYPLESLDDVLSKSDVVVLTLPLTEKTKGLINKNRFDKMKNNAVLVNIARGLVVEEKALLDALENKLLGAVVDVFESEPLPNDNPLWKKENVIITPHNSFVGDGNNERLDEVVLGNLSKEIK